MNKIYKLAAVVACVSLILPSLVSAASVKTFSGVVTKINANEITFSTTSAANYSADSSGAVLTRKNGVSMQFSEIIVGDKVQVTGTLWPDNSISASSIIDLSLYAHTGTFTGKIIAINPNSSSFTMQSKTYGNQNIQTNNFTSFSKNGQNAGFKDLILGMTMTVKGLWDRTNTQVIASSAAGTFRLISIYFTGNLSIKGSSSLTVVGNGNVIYGVDISGAPLENKSGKPLALSGFDSGDSLRVWGKHISGSVQIVGVEVRDASVTK